MDAVIDFYETWLRHAAAPVRTRPSQLGPAVVPARVKSFRIHNRWRTAHRRTRGTVKPMPTENDPGRASGFSVEENPEGGFRWSAFGPAGIRQGHTESEAEAEAAARSAEQELQQPRTGV